jgi:hypothetical protein
MDTLLRPSLNRVYKHPLLQVALAFVGAKCVSLGAVPDVHAGMISAKPVRAIAARLQTLVEHDLMMQMIRLDNELRSSPARGRALMTPDNLALLMAIFLLLRAMWFDKQPGPRYMPMLVSAISIVKEMDLIEPLRASVQLPGTAEQFLLDQEWLNTVWSAVLMDLNTFSGRGKPLITPWGSVRRLVLPAPAGVFERAMIVSLSRDASRLVFCGPRGNSAESVHELLDSSSGRSFDFLGSGLSVFRFAVCTLRARVFALVSCLNQAKLTMSDLAILEDNVERGVGITESRVLLNQDLEKAVKRRAGLLCACRLLRGSLPDELCALVSTGDIIGIEAYSALVFPDSRCEDLWSLALFLDFSTLLLLGPDPRFFPREIADAWSAKFALTPSFLESVAVAQGIAAFARRRLDNATMAPYVISSWFQTASVLVSSAQWMRLLFPRTEENEGVVVQLLEDAGACVDACGARGMSPLHDRIRGEVELEMARGLRSA